MKCRILPLTLFVFLALPAVSQAHAIVVKAFQKGSLVRVEVTFDTEDPAEDAEVIIIASDGRVVTQGMTDKNGQFTFPTPKSGDYEIVVDAGAGHRETTKLKILGIQSDVNTVPKRPGTGSKELNIAVGLLIIAVITVLWVFKRKRKLKAK